MCRSEFCHSRRALIVRSSLRISRSCAPSSIRLVVGAAPDVVDGLTRIGSAIGRAVVREVADWRLERVVVAGEVARVEVRIRCPRIGARLCICAGRQAVAVAARIRNVLPDRVLGRAAPRGRLIVLRLVVRGLVVLRLLIVRLLVVLIIIRLLRLVVVLWLLVHDRVLRLRVIHTALLLLLLLLLLISVIVGRRVVIGLRARDKRQREGGHGGDRDNTLHRGTVYT